MNRPRDHLQLDADDSVDHKRIKSMSDEKLDVRTRCIVTASAVMALTGITPAIIWRPGSDPVFQFPSDAESALQLLLRSKERLDRMVDEIVA